MEEKTGEFGKLETSLRVNDRLLLNVTRYFTFVHKDNQQILYHVNVLGNNKHLLKDRKVVLPKKIYMIAGSMLSTPDPIHREIEKHFDI